MLDSDLMTKMHAMQAEEESLLFEQQEKRTTFNYPNIMKHSKLHITHKHKFVLLSFKFNYIKLQTSSKSNKHL